MADGCEFLREPSVLATTGRPVRRVWARRTTLGTGKLPVAQTRPLRKLPKVGKRAVTVPAPIRLRKCKLPRACAPNIPTEAGDPVHTACDKNDVSADPHSCPN